MPRLGQSKDEGQAAWFFRQKPAQKTIQNGWRFTLKGSPRHYDDVRLIIEGDPGARVYFGEALTYERGAGVALWRVEATSFEWLTPLYDWWAEMERIEPIHFTFHLYLPRDWKYPALDLREHTPVEIAQFIQQNAPRGADKAIADARRQ